VVFNGQTYKEIEIFVYDLLSHNITDIALPPSSLNKFMEKLLHSQYNTSKGAVLSNVLFVFDNCIILLFKMINIVISSGTQVGRYMLSVTDYRLSRFLLNINYSL
jgi:hypothetical protein